MKNKKIPNQKYINGFLTNICVSALYCICLLGLYAYSVPTQEWDNSIDKGAIPAESPRIPKPKVIREVSKPKKFRRKGGGWYTKMPWE